MAQIEVDSKKAIIAVTVLVIIIVVVFLFGRQKGKDEKEVKEVDVKVNLKDENGNTINYDPTPLLERLNKGLITRYYFDFSERCGALTDLYSLDSVRFVAAVRSYQTKYDVSLKAHLDACWVGCGSLSQNGKSIYQLINERYDALKSVIK